MTATDQKLAAVRFLLGDDLTTRLIEDQWNVVNDFNDPYDVEENTTRASLDSTRLAARVIGALMEAVKAPAMELGDRQQAAFNALTEEERQTWLSKGGPKPESYAAVTCAPFEGPGPDELFADLKAENARLQAMLDEGQASPRPIIDLTEVSDIVIDDGGHALQVVLTGADPIFDVEITSWDEQKKHEMTSSLIGKKLRVSVNVLGDEDPSEGLPDEEKSISQLTLEIHRLEQENTHKHKAYQDKAKAMSSEDLLRVMKTDEMQEFQDQYRDNAERVTHLERIRLQKLEAMQASVSSK